MGNQMFQLAFAHAAARTLGTRYVLGANDLAAGFLVPSFVSGRERTARALAFRARHARPRHVEITEDADPADALADLRDGVAYGGFYQSECWFTGYEDEVRALLRVRPEHEAAFTARYGDLPGYACLHVRRGDYLDASNGFALPAGYFLRAAEAAEGRPIVVISDDIPRVRQELAALPDARFDANPAMVDLLLLMNADVVVTSNSSFSWWGAWLNRRPDPTVIAPAGWFSFGDGIERPRGVIPPRWTTIDAR
jgi:hypothetical protein